MRAATRNVLLLAFSDYLVEVESVVRLPRTMSYSLRRDETWRRLFNRLLCTQFDLLRAKYVIGNRLFGNRIIDKVRKTED